MVSNVTWNCSKHAESRRQNQQNQAPTHARGRRPRRPAPVRSHMTHMTHMTHTHTSRCGTAQPTYRKNGHKHGKTLRTSTSSLIRSTYSQSWAKFTSTTAAETVSRPIHIHTCTSSCHLSCPLLDSYPAVVQLQVQCFVAKSSHITAIDSTSLNALIEAHVATPSRAGCSYPVCHASNKPVMHGVIRRLIHNVRF